MSSTSGSRKANVLHAMTVTLCLAAACKRSDTPPPGDASASNAVAASAKISTKADSLHHKMQTVLALAFHDKSLVERMVPPDGDGQGFAVTLGGTYGPIAFVVPEPRSDTLTQLRHFQGAAGALVARIGVAPAPGRLNSSYQDLHLTTANAGYCVRLRLDGSRWRGYVIPVGVGMCSNSTTTPAAQYELEVVRETAHSSSLSDYPVAARWGVARATLDPRPRRTTIEVRCGAGWCSFLPPNTELAATAQDPGGHGSGDGSGPVQLRGKIRGWFDEQVVSVPGSSGSLQEAHWASVVPAENLHTYTSVVAFDSGFVEVAAVHLFNAPTPGDKYDVAGLHEGANPIEIRHTPSRWEFRVGPHGTPKEAYWAPRPTPGPWTPSFGTVRWAWPDTDEDLWVSCAMGCCYVDLT